MQVYPFLVSDKVRRGARGARARAEAFGAMVRARERAFVAKRPDVTLPGFGGGGKVEIRCELGGRWCGRSGGASHRW